MGAKAENAVDFSGLIHQAIVILEKGRFISPWKHILVDEFQEISPQRAASLAALRKQNSQTTLFAVGDDWQANSSLQACVPVAHHRFPLKILR
ncbi:UvrD-helicase domain-containing protein [Shigella sonnei]